jgi:hypothetical protein
MSKPRMGDLYRVEQLASQSMHLEDILTLMDIPPGDMEAMLSDPDVLHAHRAGLARGLREVTSAVREQAIHGSTPAARVILARAGQAGDAADAVERHQRQKLTAVEKERIAGEMMDDLARRMEQQRIYVEQNIARQDASTDE